jgi:hypothetical protein
MSPDDATLPALEAECFFIAPIGSEDSDERRRSDGVKDYIVAPAAIELGLVVVRADLIAAPGQITRQVIEHVVGARAAVVDLTGANANVYYEMAVRHTAQLPTVLIAEKDSKLPFDIAQMRTIFFDHRDLKSAADCSRDIVRHLQEAMAGAVDSPIASSVAVSAFREGTQAEQLLAEVVSTVESVSANVRSLEERIRRDRSRRNLHPEAIRDLNMALDGLLAYQEQKDEEDVDLSDLLATLRKPITYLGRQALYDSAPSRPAEGHEPTRGRVRPRQLSEATTRDPASQVDEPSTPT